MSDTILVVNAGSSSLKFQLLDIDSDRAPARQLRGQMEGIGSRPRLQVRDAGGASVADQTFDPREVPDVAAAQEIVGGWLLQHVGEFPAAVGHRVVHGGPHYAAPTIVDDEVLARLERLVPLAPLHQPNNLAPIRALRRRRPDLMQVACFDTAFHRGHPEIADRFAVPEELYREGVRRYGFHGLSYEYVCGRLAEIAPELAAARTVIAHLGSGCSMCATVNGRSLESTMGFTALDGLPMGTRPGQLDPGVVLYLIREKGMDVAAVERLLYRDCGLKGLSGIGNDVRDLLSSSDPRARMALDHFTYRIAMAAGALAAAAGGLDALVFTAGVGENAPRIRKAVADRLHWLGVELDALANDRNEQRISARGSRVAVLVVPTDEELMIARHTHALARQAHPEPA
jgi:acetate kinase